MTIGPVIRRRYLELFVPKVRNRALLVGVVSNQEYDILTAKGYMVTKADLNPIDESVVALDLTKPPLEMYEQFSLVVASDVLEHIPDDRAAVAGIYHLLEPGGLAYVHTPGGDINAPLNDHDRKHGHVRHGYTEKQIKSVISTQPFTQIQHFKTLNEIEKQAIQMAIARDRQAALDHLKQSPFDGKSGTHHLFLLTK